MKFIKTFLPDHGCRPGAMLSTLFMCTKQIFDGGIFCVIGSYFLQTVQFAILVLVWSSLAKEGADLGGMELHQLLTYSLMATVLQQELNIISPATSALWEGSILGRFTRPIPVPVSFIAETIGRHWVPNFLFFGLPMLILAPLIGVSPLPAGPCLAAWSLLSLLMSASLGFAMDLLFASFAMYLKNGCFAALAVREAAYSLLSGEMIPFALFPKAIGNLFSLLPFGSIAHAPLTIYVGAADHPLRLMGLQLFWNVVLWTAAAAVFKKSKERMISFGG